MQNRSSRAGGAEGSNNASLGRPLGSSNSEKKSLGMKAPALLSKLIFIQFHLDLNYAGSEKQDV